MSSSSDVMLSHFGVRGRGVQTLARTSFRPPLREEFELTARPLPPIKKERQIAWHGHVIDEIIHSANKELSTQADQCTMQMERQILEYMDLNGEGRPPGSLWDDLRAWRATIHVPDPDNIGDEPR